MRRSLIAVFSLVLIVVSIGAEEKSGTQMAYDNRILKCEQQMATQIHRVDAAIDRVDNCCECIKSNAVATARMLDGERDRVRAFVNECEREVDSVVAEKGFYEKRYGELKAGHDRFMVYVNGFLVVITILFAAIGAVVAWWGIVRPSMKLKAIDTEWNGLRIDIDKLKANAHSSIEWSRSSKAEQYFQMARLGFAQYKTLKDVNTLEIVVKFLSQSIMHNVGAMNAVGAKSSIAFLNTVMNKHVSEDSDLPKEIEDHRIIVCTNLKDWDWGVDVDALKLVFENSEIDDSYASMCVTNFKKVVAKCRK